MQPSYILPTGVDPDLSDIKTVLVVVAHPDDIDFGCAGTVAKLTSQGINVSYCLVTSGDAGGDKDESSREQRVDKRESEQKSAAAKVAVDKIHFLRQPDGTVESNLLLREKLTRVIRKEKPDLVITQSPNRRYDRIYASHPDHLATGEATICACYPDCQNPHAYPNLLDEGCDPHIVKAMWIMVDESPDVFVDITDVFDQKMEALLEHKSQIEDGEAVKEMMREWALTQAELAGYQTPKLAESFRFVQIAP